MQSGSTTRPYPRFLLSHLLHRITTLIFVTANLSLGICRVFADNLGEKQCRPNIVLILADDLGWGDVGYHGSKADTPSIDRLVSGGVEFDQHYVQPVCTPTRTALMTGRYPSRHGPQAMHPSNLRALMPGTETLASALKSQGYTTHIAGKWHLGSRPEWGPNHYGFDHSYGSLVGAVDPWTHQYRQGPWAKTWHRDEKIFEEQGNATELVAKEVDQWIRSAKGPWLVYVPFHAVHIPIDTPEEYKKHYDGRKFNDDPELDASYRRFAAFITQMDTKIGQFVKAVDETGQRDNTLILFTSDNGGKTKGGNPYVGNVPGTPLLSSNGQLRGEKGGLFEGGIRVPAFANWPARLKPRKVTSVMHAVDWMPTLTKLVGYTPSSDLKWDGRDVWPLVTGEQTKAEPRTLYIALPGQAALRDGDWKLIAAKDNRNLLFNLANDPYEKTDLAQQEPQRVQELVAQLAKMREQDRPTLPEDLQGIKD